MKQWDGLVERYAAVLRTRGISEETIRHRQRELERFGAWLKGRRPKPSVEDVDAELVVRYVQARSAFHSKSTVASVVSSLRCMGEFLVQDGAWRTNPLRWMRGPKIHLHRRLPKRIDRAQQQSLWAAAQGRRQEHARYQSICILALLYGTGLRRGELARLDLGDWNRESRTLKVDGHKTGVERCVPVGEGVWRCIEAYLPHRHNRLEATGRLDEQALLINTFGQRMTGQSVSIFVGRLAKSADVEHVTLHQFRHSCASDLLEAGVTLPEVQRMLGHAAIQTTVRYAAVADPQRALAMSKHPLNRFLQPPPEERKAS